MVSNNELATTEDSVPAIVSEFRPMSFKNGMMLLPVAEQEVMLAQYDERRNYFLKWLLSKLIQGIHYGFPPGCEPKGDVDPKQWTAKPSLYKAGALLVKDLLAFRDRYTSDELSWKMMGEPKGVIVRKCTLIDPRTSIEIGEGTGAAKVGQKSRDSNAAIKVADKCALVAAIINAVPVLGDLFTQDLETLPGAKSRMSLPDRKERLIFDIDVKMQDTDSTFTGDAPAMAKILLGAWKKEIGSRNPRLSTVGEVDAFEKWIEVSAIDWNTGEIIKPKQ